jgi:hypothetical protein
MFIRKVPACAPNKRPQERTSGIAATGTGRTPTENSIQGFGPDASRQPVDHRTWRADSLPFWATWDHSDNIRQRPFQATVRRGLTIEYNCDLDLKTIPRQKNGSVPGGFVFDSWSSIRQSLAIAEQLGVWRYLTSAFSNPWNLLFLFGGLGFAALSGQQDIAIPLVLAAETLYLGALGTHPRFQAYVDAQAAKAQRQMTSQRNQEILQRIVRSLPEPLYGRYEQLRQRCLDLKQIAVDLKDHVAGEAPISLESAQTQSLDRLLWVFLRLLFTQHSLERFFDTVSLETLQAEEKQMQQQLNRLDANDSSPHGQKVRHAVSDNLKTMQDRIENFRRADSNYRYVQLELDRLENKIKSLAEMAVNRQDPDYVSSQVDAVANSMLETEKTMNDLRFVTGLGQVDEETPDLLTEPPVMIR